MVGMNMKNPTMTIFSTEPTRRWDRSPDTRNMGWLQRSGFNLKIDANRHEEGPDDPLKKASLKRLSVIKGVKIEDRL